MYIIHVLLRLTERTIHVNGLVNKGLSISPDIARVVLLTSWHLQVHDLHVAEVVQVLSQNPQGVPVAHDQDPLPLLDPREDLLLPEGDRPLHGVLQALVHGEVHGLETLLDVARVGADGVKVGVDGTHWRGWDVIGTAPQLSF